MMKIHREGRWIVLATVLLLLALVAATALFLPFQLNYVVSAFSLVVLILVLRFFRVPVRLPYLDERTVTAPADGKIVVIERTEQKEYLNGPCIQVSIFMSIHDVHINYYPVGGNKVERASRGHLLVWVELEADGTIRGIHIIAGAAGGRLCGQKDPLLCPGRFQG